MNFNYKSLAALSKDLIAFKKKLPNKVIGVPLYVNELIVGAEMVLPSFPSFFDVRFFSL
jgi:predicted cobalt transporter CbtA